MNFKRLSIAALISLLAGCAATTAPQMRTDAAGQAFVGNFPVIARGKLLRIEVVDKDGKVQSAIGGVAGAVSDSVGDAGIAAGLSDAGAFSSGSGIIVGIVAGIVGDIAKRAAPAPPMLFVENDEGVELQFPLTFEFVKDGLGKRCVAEGDDVQVVQADKDRFEVFSTNSELVRLATSEASCEEKVRLIAMADQAENDGSAPEGSALRE